tara:strand:- start:237 stop:911 length:675 start_codon:yes stop_codon:yes gene_type:complete
MILGINLFLSSFTLEAIQTQIITWENTELSSLLKPGESYTKASFRTHNNGQFSIRINEARSESNAIKTIIKKRIIEPGESATIEVIFLPEGKEAGLYHNKIDVIFEGHKEPLATLHYIVTVPKLIKCSPNMITWEEGNLNDSFLVELELDDRFITSLSAIDYDQSLYQVSIIPDKLENSKYTLKIEPIVEKRPFNSLIKIKASGPQLTEIEEPIFLFNSYSLSQ